MVLFKKNHTFILYLLMVILGIVAGFSDLPVLQKTGLLLTDIFINLFKCISMPIIALSLIVTLVNYGEDRSMKTVLRKTTFFTITTTLIAATVSCFLYFLIQPSNVHDVHVAVDTLNPTREVSYTHYLSTLIPSNIFGPFIDHQVMSVLMFGLVIGIAIRYIPDKNAQLSIKNFFKGMHGLFFVITRWVVLILPLGLFGFITTTIVQMREGMNIAGIGQYLSVIVLANLIQGFIILPLWLLMNKINPFKTLHGMLPALSIAFFSKSSAGTLPITMETAEKRLKLNPKISRFVLPLCTSVNMNGCAAFIFATVIYLMQNYGIAITPMTLFSWIIIATIAAIGNAGVPMGCFFLSASLLSSMNVPIVLLGIILPFYSMIDMIETALNVWSDSCVAKVIDTQYVQGTSVVHGIDIQPEITKQVGNSL